MKNAVEVKTIDRMKLERFILDQKGKIFSCVFIKKDGTIRKMSCRLGVTKGIKGTGKPISNSSNSYMTVYDMQKKNYRVINLATLINIQIGGVGYNVKG